MAIAIPKHQFETIEWLLKSEAAKLKDLAAILKSSCPALFPEEIAKKISANVGIPAIKARGIAMVLMSMYATRVSQRLTVEKFLADFCESIQAAGISAEKPQWNIFKEFVTEVLKLKGAIEVTSKAPDILLGNERNFVDGKIFTDLRPIFRENPSEAPAGAVIVHTLRLEYMDGNERKQFFIALDSSDLKVLKQTLERAAIKEASILSFVSQTGLPVVAPENRV